ncbi:hypothetical protein ACEPAF_6069 [Sanghuangporus sanghuang]
MFPKPRPDIEKALENVRMESSKFQQTARFTGNSDYTRDKAVRSHQAFEYWEDIEQRHLRAGHILRIDRVKLRTVRLLWEYYGYSILRRRLCQLVRAQESEMQQQQQQQQQQRSQQVLSEPSQPLPQPQQQQQQQPMLPEQFPPQQQQQQQHQMLPQDVDSPMEVDSAPLQVETGETIEDGEVAEPVETLETGAERLEGASRSTPLTSLEPTMLEIELRESERREEEERAAQRAEISRMAAEIEANMRQRLDAGTRRVRGVRQVVDSDEETPAIQESPESPPPGHRGEDSVIMSPGDGGMDIGDVGMEANEPFEADASLEEIQALNTASNNNSNNNNNNSGTAAVPRETVETQARRVSPARRASSQPEAGPSRIPANGGGSGGDDNDNDDDDDDDDDDGDERLGDGRVRHRVPCDQCQKRGRDCVGLPQRTCAPLKLLWTF